MKKQIILTSMAAVVLLIGLHETTVKADSPPVSSLYTHNFNAATFYAPDGVTTRAANSGYNEHIVRDICGRDWTMTMGQKYLGEAYIGWNNVQTRAESSTALVQARYPGMFDYSAGKYYSAIGSLFDVQNIKSVEFQYTSAYLAGKSIWIIMSQDGGVSWSIVVATSTIDIFGTAQTYVSVKYTFPSTVASARFAFVQNYNSFGTSVGRIKMTNVIVEVV